MSISTRTRTRRPGRYRRFVASALVAAALATGSVVTTSVAANAVPTAWLNACFKAPSYAYGVTTWGKWTRPVILDVSVNGGWYQTYTYSPNMSTGCVSVPVPTGQYFRLRVNHTEWGYRYTGTTGYVWTGGEYTYNLGTVYLGQTRA